jgi:hypothetical protein
MNGLAWRDSCNAPDVDEWSVSVQTLINLFSTFETLGDKTAFVNRTGVRRLKVSYGRSFTTFCL